MRTAKIANNLKMMFFYPQGCFSSIQGTDHMLYPNSTLVGASDIGPVLKVYVSNTYLSITKNKSMYVDIILEL